MRQSIGSVARDGRNSLLRRSAPLLAALALLGLPAAAQAQADEGSMRFEWVKEGPAETCGDKCREWIAAVGPIGFNTVQDFEMFAKVRDVRGATVVLDSPGGVVTTGMDLGRAFRRAGVNTTIGRTVKLPADAEGEQRARYVPQGTCASMCPFVLLGGAKRAVPNEAKVMVHQIWPGSARGDAPATAYSAEDMMRIQQDLAKLARYTIDMGATIEFYEIALRIPPWEYLRHLTREEIRRTRLHTADSIFANPAKAAVGSSAVMGANVQTAWALIDKDGGRQIARRHPLTVEGESIGSFEITLSCGPKPGTYAVAYAEDRKMPKSGTARLKEVAMWIGNEHVVLALTDGEGGVQAAGEVSEKIVNAYADPRKTITVSTATLSNVRTATMVGNAGLRQSFTQLASSCPKPAEVAGGGGKSAS